jgi:hypothetical protein
MPDLALVTLTADNAAPAADAVLADADGTYTLPGAYAPERTILIATNTDADAVADLTLLAGADPPAGAQGQGPLAFSLDPSVGDVPSVVIGPFTSYRFVQADGTLALTVALNGGDGVSLVAYTLPRV